jgi:hypothetical protein
MSEGFAAVIEFLFRWAKIALWFLVGCVVVPAYVISNLYFEKWWKWREDF